MRNVIETIFRVLRRRFWILNTTPEYNLTSEAQLILVICAIHNWIRTRANGKQDGFYEGLNLPPERQSLDREEEICTSSELGQGSGQGSDIGEIMVDREH